MTDPPTPPASADPPPPSAKVRWFAAEYLIVVFGVLTAVGINAWWQGRQDAATELNYLRQLASDLESTAALLVEVDATLAPSERAAARLFDGFRSRAPVPSDSILVWVSVATVVQTADPVLGTAEALVATGDLALLRDDSLRTAIPAYLEQQRTGLGWQALIMTRSVDALLAVQRHVDLLEADAAQVAAGGRLLVPRPGVLASDSVVTSASPFAFDADRFLADREAYNAVYTLGLTKIQARSIRAGLALNAQNLRRRVDAELNR